MTTSPPSYYSYDDEGDDFEIELYESTAERNIVDNMANLFAIITTCEHLEKAYTRNAIDADPYKNECLKLISQFKLAEKAVPMNVEEFMKAYDMEGNYPLAVDRLLRSGVPATTLHAIADDRDMTVLVQEATEKFITVRKRLYFNITTRYNHFLNLMLYQTGIRFIEFRPTCSRRITATYI